jgi:hypothetical protein
MVLISSCSFNLSIHTYNIVYNLFVVVTMNEYAWLFIFLEGRYNFHQNYECGLHNSPLTFISAKIKIKKVNFLLTFNP